MKVSDISSLAGIDFAGGAISDAELNTGYTSDLLSDVMGNAEEGSVLITIQAHKNTIAVCSLAGVSAIVFCNNRPVADEVVEAAMEEGIALFKTAENQFVTSALIARALDVGA